VGLTRAAGAVSLIWGWGALLAAAALLLRVARRPLRRWGPLELEEADETSMEGMRGASRYLGESSLGRWLVVSTLGMVLALFIAQYLYSEIFLRAYPGPTDLAAFFGAYLAATNLIEIGLELALTPWLIRRFGVPTAQLVHPFVTLLSFGGLAVSYGLVAGIGARVSRELVENAVAQPLRSLVYNALPQRLRGRIRAFLELIVMYGGMSAAGLLLVVLGDPEPRLLAAAGAGSALVYVAASLRVRSEYLRELVAGIRAGRLDFGTLGEEIGDLETSRLTDLCGQLLNEEIERPSRSLLRLLPTLAKRGVAAPLLEGALHPHPTVREVSILELDALRGEPGCLELVRGALFDADARVRLAALQVLADDADPATEDARATLLHDPDPRVRAAASFRLGAEGIPVLREMLLSEDPDAARAALSVAPRELAPEVIERTADPEPSLRAAALGRALLVAGDLALPEETLPGALAAAEPAVRQAAVALSAARAPDHLEPVAAALADPSVEVRRTAATALIARGAPGVRAAEPYLRDAREPAAEGALRVTAEAAAAPLRAQLLRAELRHRVHQMWYALIVFQRLLEGDGVEARFLRVAFSDAILRHRRVAFSTLALLENQRIIRKVDRALHSAARRTRSDALEVLSNLGDREAAQLLVLMHEAGALDDRLEKVREVVEVPKALPGILLEASRSDSRWIRAAVAAIDSGLGENDVGTDVMERLLALKQVSLFQNLSLDQLEAIHQLANEVTFAADEVVMREGEPGYELFILLEGALDVYLGWGTPEQSRRGEIRPINYVGEMAILGNEDRTATIVAVEHSRMLSLDGESLKDLILQMPEISFEIFRVLIRRVRTAERRLQELG
jgi:HEAT repeat protein